MSKKNLNEFKKLKDEFINISNDKELSSSFISEILFKAYCDVDKEQNIILELNDKVIEEIEIAVSHICKNNPEKIDYLKNKIFDFFK